jgi:hypothetical protein
MALALGTGCRVTAPSDQGLGLKMADDVAANAIQVRLRMRASVEPLSGAIIDAADGIAEATPDKAIQREALVWKMQAVPALREALFRPNPWHAILDAWVLSWQMAQYFEAGPGREALGGAAPLAFETSMYLENQIESIAASLTHSGDVSEVRRIARNWAANHPIKHSIASRDSILASIAEIEIQETFSTQEVVGNVAVTVDDLSRRIDIYSVQLPDQARWQAELFAMDLAGHYELEQAVPLASSAVRSASEAVEVLKQLAPSMEEALRVAEAAPEVISAERAVAIEAAQAEISRTIEFVQAERIAALEHLSNERETALNELHQTIIEERKLLMADLEQVTLTAVDHTILRAAQLTAGILVAVFIGMLVLLFIASRLWKKPR